MLGLTSRTRLARFVAALFFFSGATALLYQVAFGKKLSTIFGATAYAVSAVLAAFMLGLALGSHLGGRFGGRVRRPMLLYGVAEVVVGLVCAVTPLLFDGITHAYVASVTAAPGSLALVSAVRALLTALVVVVPTVAMGITLPLLSRAVARHGDTEQNVAESRRRLAILYAVNTAGGALGALASAYWILPALGVYRTMRAAALVNIAIGVLAIAVGRRRFVVPRSDPVADSSRDADGQRAEVSGEFSPDRRLLSGLAFASGLLVFAAEVVDTHLLALLIGNSAYAFGLMLAVFLTCLSIGALLAGQFERRFGAHALSAGLATAAFATILVLPIWGQLPRVFIVAGAHVHSWVGRELVRALVAVVVLAVPTVAMGLTFPLLLRRVAGRDGVERGVGRLAAINTIGSIVGAIVTGYFVLPAVGSERTVRLIALAFVLCALLALRSPQSGRFARRYSFVALACAALVVLVPSWDMKLMTNGANVYFDAQSQPDALLYVREDVHGGLTSVARRGNVRTLYTNGKFQGNDGHEIDAQRSFAHYPSLFVERHRNALVIGLGTGTTLGTIAAYPYERIDVAEISPSIVEAARLHFSTPNRRSLDDERVNLILNDGRNYLLVASPRYDLITIELTSVWFAGAANLYSVEFYELCKKRLTDGGVLQQWLQLHHIRRQEVAVVLRTLREVFPHAALFVGGGQGIVVASTQPLVADRDRLAQLARRPAIAESLHGRSLEGLLDRMVFSGADLDRFVSESAAEVRVSNDENLYLEYATPKGNVMSYSSSYESMVAALSRYRTSRPRARHLR